MILRHRDKEILRFEWLEPQGVRVVSVNAAETQFQPLEFRGAPTDENLWKWLVHRIVPSNRAHIQDLLLKLGYDPHDVKGIIRLCKGLSLNDVYGLFSLADSFLKLSPTDDTIKSKISEGDTLNPAIVANMKADPFITIDELANMLSVPRPTLQRHIKALRLAGVIARQGARKTGSWSVDSEAFELAFGNK